jgi:hypothetical protein
MQCAVTQPIGHLQPEGDAYGDKVAVDHLRWR